MVGLFALAKAAALDGREHAALGQFFGRFHPTVVHLPIGLMLLVPVLEVWGLLAKRQDLRNAAGLVLGLAAAAALFAAGDGWLLAWSGGYKGSLVVRHMWGGVAFAGAAMLCCTLRWRALSPTRRPDRGPDRGQATKASEASAAQTFDPVGSESGGNWRAAAYSLSLLAALGVLTWASHMGGSLSHGDNFLTEYMPGRLRALLHLAPARVAAAPAGATGGIPTVYAQQIQPIFDHSCVSCHGPEKSKGGLKLDTYENLLKGGDNGLDVEPWQPAKSEVLRRVKLDPDDDDFMPNNGKNLLTDEQKALIEKWINAGASDRQPLLDR